MSTNIRKRREKLWAEKQGKCYWCNIDTVMPPRNVNQTVMIPNLATVDHLRSRLTKNRIEPNKSNEERTVLSCWTCNLVRGILDQKFLHPIVVCINEKVKIVDKKI